MVNYKIGEGMITLNTDGTCSLSGAENVPAAHVVMDEVVYPSTSIRLDGNNLAIGFNNTEVQVAVVQKESYTRFTVTDVNDCVDAWIWGPFLTGYTGECGEVIGIARENNHCVGIQALNPKTVAGFPGELTPKHPMASDIPSRKGLREQVATCAALPLYKGTALQAFTRNRTKVAHRDFYYAQKALVLPVEGEDALIKGSSIVLYACDNEKALDVIEQIENNEGLPHTLVKVEWTKRSKRANTSYLITDFDRQTFEEALEYVKESGLSCIYHPGFFKNWGHFEIDVPDGEELVKACVEKAAESGIDVGVHVLSNFMTTNDPYVTPVPHPNLLKMGETKIREAIDEKQTAIEIEDEAFFTRLSTLNAVRIDDELIHYTRVENLNGKAVLADCERGAWGTVASGHSVHSTAARLWDYDYRTLFPDIKLQREFSKRLGELFRSTGLKRVSFDGLAADYTGHENYAQALFVKDCYDIWGPYVVSDASGLTHYNWHMHSYMNWGEPWYADMRNGMFDYRRSNQDYFRRNLLAPMMGWFTLRKATRKYESTTPDDMNWMLSKSAGFGAGFAFSANIDALRSHGKSHEYMKLINSWENMRLYGDIPAQLKLEMQDQKSEWDIESVENGWNVYHMTIANYECSPEGAQPGMPSGADWMTFNPYAQQKMVFRFRAGDERDRGGISNLTFRAGENFISFKVRIECGQYLIYDGSTTADICDKNFNVIKRIQGDGEPLILDQGISMLLFKCTFDGEEPPYPQVKMFMKDKAVFVPRIK
jgi:hypothetical protein